MQATRQTHYIGTFVVELVAFDAAESRLGHASQRLRAQPAHAKERDMLTKL